MSSIRHSGTVRTPVATQVDKCIDAHVQSLARMAQVHECLAYCSDTKRSTACRFGFPQNQQHESDVQAVFRNNMTKKVISTQRNHPRVNAYNPTNIGLLCRKQGHSMSCGCLRRSRVNGVIRLQAREEPEIFASAIRAVSECFEFNGQAAKSEGSGGSSEIQRGQHAISSPESVRSLAV